MNWTSVKIKLIAKRYILPIFSASALILFFNNCGLISQPKVDNASYASAGYAHQGNETNCASCHDPRGDRPTVVNTPVIWQALNMNLPFEDQPSIPPTSQHFLNTQYDCSFCHVAQTGVPTWAGWATGNFAHASSTGAIINSTCATCHEGERPSYGVNNQICNGGPGASNPSSCANGIVTYYPPNGTTSATFDHTQGAAGTGECFSCHTQTMNNLVNQGALAWYPATIDGNSNSDDTRSFSISYINLNYSYGGVVVGVSDPSPAGTSGSITVPMIMNHNAAFLSSFVPSNCTTCHANAGTTGWYPGVFHKNYTGTLSSCVDCHNYGTMTLTPDQGNSQSAGTSSVVPPGFVGSAPAAGQPYSRSTPIMNHFAPLFSASGTTYSQSGNFNPGDCVTCHQAPSGQTLSGTPGAWWGVPKGGTLGGSNPHNVSFHTNYPASGLSQCQGCHVDSRPTTTPVGISGTFTNGFYHNAVALNGAGQGDCATCHATAATNGSFVTWATQFHALSQYQPPTLTTCQECHNPERPLALNNPIAWAGYSASSPPFVYGAAVASSYAATVGVVHGNNTNDCYVCHTNAGKGAWPANESTGGTQNFASGYFNHESGGKLVTAANSCNPCHIAQRPDNAGYSVANVGYDHAGAGDCANCHQATVTAGSFAKYLGSAANASVSIATTSDWKGGVGYPAGTYATAAITFSITEFFYSNLSTNTSFFQSAYTSSAFSLTDYVLHNAPAIPPCGQPYVTKASCASAAASSYPATAAAFAAGSSVMNCQVCHAAVPGSNPTSPANATVHTGLKAWGMSITSNCIQCHGSYSGGSPANTANIEPGNGAAAGTAANVVMHLGSTFQPMDHTATFVAGGAYANVQAMDCSICHNTTYAGIYATNPSITPAVGAFSAQDPNNGTWKQGIFHQNTAGLTPTSCKQCHHATMETISGGSGVAFTDSVTGLSGLTGQMHHEYIPTLNGSTAVNTEECSKCHTVSNLQTGTTTYAASAWSSASFHTNLPSNGQPTSACTNCHTSTVPPNPLANIVSYTPVAGNGNTTNSFTPAQGTLYVNFSHASSTDGNFTVNCENCHTASSASNTWAGAHFHNYENTQLTGCRACHAPTMPTSNLTNSSAGATDFSHSSVVGTGDCNGCHGPTIAFATASSPTWYGAKATGHASPWSQGCASCHDGRAGSYNNAMSSVVGTWMTEPWVTTMQANAASSLTYMATSSYSFSYAAYDAAPNMKDFSGGGGNVSGGTTSSSSSCTGSHCGNGGGSGGATVKAPGAFDHNWQNLQNWNGSSPSSLPDCVNCHTQTGLAQSQIGISWKGGFVPHNNYQGQGTGSGDNGGCKAPSTPFSATHPAPIQCAPCHGVISNDGDNHHSGLTTTPLATCLQTVSTCLECHSSYQPPLPSGMTSVTTTHNNSTTTTTVYGTPPNYGGTHPNGC